MANNHSEIERRLWASADELRANSKLKSSEYSVPVLGLSGRGSVRILTGFYQCFTKPDALRKLLTLKSQFGASRFDVRVANGLHFHWKAYFLFTASKATIAIGSSNLTSDGLKSSGEMNLTLSLPRSAAQVGAIHGVFEAEWKRAKPLTATLISEYEKARPKQAGRVI